MSASCCRRWAVMAGCLSFLLPIYALDVPTESTPAQTADLRPYSPTTYPQIVRIRYAEGDVRVSRGKRGATWESAVSGLPLETGFNLVTGDGRAEIEFEDASTLYLAEDSALVFDDLETTAGVPKTEIGLLSGTVTLNVNETIAGESFGLDTPTHHIAIGHPNHIYERVTSYLDGMVVAPLVLTRPEAHLAQTTYSVFGKVEEPAQSDSFVGWDTWVSGRVADRSAAMTSVMKASGLTSPLPGLADMEGQGEFFPCAPYGTCWVPAELPGERANIRTPDSPQDVAQAGASPSQTVGPSSRVRAPAAAVSAPRDNFFPCLPGGNYVRGKNPLTGGPNVRSANLSATPYDWSVCHAGTWIYWRHRYAWVAGERRHHHCPVNWVKSGHHLAFVPIHPKDVAGRAPLNREHGVFEVSGKHGSSVQWARLDPGHGVKVLSQAPKEFHSLPAPPLARAASPQVEAHHVPFLTIAGRTLSVKEPATNLSFDRKSQSFELAKHGSPIMRNSPERAAISSRIGNLQARAGGVDGHGNYSFHSGASNGGYARAGSVGAGGSHGGSSAGGGFHGGGSSGGGGGSHGGGSSGGGGGSAGGGSAGGGSAGGGSAGGGSAGGSSGGGGGHR
jgi:FecR protein